MNPVNRTAIVIVGLLPLLAGCASQARFASGEDSAGMHMRVVVGEPMDDVSGQQVAEPSHGPLNTISTESLQRQRQEVYDDLGSAQVELAEDYVTYSQREPDASDSVKEEFAAWGELSPDEVAVLPPAYQYHLPTIGCGQLNARLAVVESSPEEEFAGCLPHHSEPGTYVKYLLNEVQLTSDDVATASAEADQSGSGTWAVAVEFTADGKQAWSQLATAAVNKQVAILVGNSLVAAPQVQPDAATKGQIQITGGFTKSHANQLVRHILSG